jgi:hypothetical protein
MLPQELLAELPGSLRPLITMASLENRPHVVLLFSGSEPVRGRSAERAVRRLERLGIAGPVLSVANQMTQEAAELFHSHNIRILALNTDFWSDESSDRIRTLIGCRVKNPDHR